MTATTKYVIKYKLNGERRFEFAQLHTNSVEEAKQALATIHAPRAANTAGGGSTPRDGARSPHRSPVPR